MYHYNAFVHRVVDGDTYDVEIDVGFGLSYKARLRLMEIDTPETWRPKSDAEREHGELATERVKDLIEGQWVEVKTYKLGIYGRYGAEVIVPDGRNLADILREEGLEKKESYE